MMATCAFACKSQVPSDRSVWSLKGPLRRSLFAGVAGTCCVSLACEELAVKIVDVRERDEHGACAALGDDCLFAQPRINTRSGRVGNLQGSGAVSKSRDRVTRTEVDLWTKD